MNRLRGFLRQHVIALLALALVVGGGAAFAAGTKLPKNSVASKQVKNNSLKGKDIKDKSLAGADLRDGTITGADLADGTIAGADLTDGTITGADLTDGTVQASDLAPDAADTVEIHYYSSGDDNVVWTDPEVGTITFSLSCGADLTVNSFVSAVKSPARAGAYGVEDINSGTEAAGTSPLVGAATVSRLGDVGMPVGGAGFGGSKFGFGQLVYFIQTPTIEVYVDLKVSLCSARGTISVNHDPEGSILPTPAPPKPGVAQARTVCESSGAGTCTEAAA